MLPVRAVSSVIAAAWPWSRLVDEEVLVLRVLLEEAEHVFAGHLDATAVSPDVVECTGDELRRQALPLVRVVNLRVREQHDVAVTLLRHGESGDFAVDEDHVPGPFGNMDDLDVAHVFNRNQ